jgi:tetratricopeptide (TPR) repeat protein
MDYTGAIQDYSQSLALDPRRSTPLIQRGWAYLVSEAPSLALNDFNEAIRIAPDNPDAYNGRGFARVLTGQTKEAIDDANAAILRGPNDARTHYNAARIYTKAALAVTSANPRKSQKLVAEEYQDRAQVLIRMALERMPPSDRGHFWRTVIQEDPALSALRQRPKFSQLASQFGRMAQ